MKVKVGISNRHIHLCENDYKILFGNKEMIKRN
ncbi:MAG: PduL/EutD family phosphate acyltransferase [bacterium]|nr:PduL/EutD family phosphate acyltransferase [bacterium]